MGGAWGALIAATPFLILPGSHVTPEFLINHRGRAAMIVCAVATLIGCGQTDSTLPSAPIAPPSKPAAYSLFDPEAGFISLAVVTGPAGTYSFHTNVVGGGLYAGGGDLDVILSVPATPDNAWFHYAYFPVDASSWGLGATAQVTINEVSAPPNVAVDSIRVVKNGVWAPTLFLVSSVTVETGYNDVIFVKFYHSEGSTPPPPPYGKGCTPGYWKQSQHFDSWTPTGLAPTNLVGSVFSNASLYSLSGKTMANYKLVEALAFKGGNGLVGAAQILLRASVAAELNAKYPGMGYPKTAAEVVTAVNAALASGNRVTMLTLATQLDELNNLGCVLN